MKVGDLVRYAPPSYSNRAQGRWPGSSRYLGLIVREIPGTDERKVVVWFDENGASAENGSYRARDLALVNENR